MNVYNKRYGPIYRGTGFNRVLICSSDVELNELVLNSSVHITKGRQYNSMKSWLGTGLLLSDGKKWHARRKIITPTFHFKILEQFVEVFDQHSNIFVNQLLSKADGRSAFDVSEFVGLVTLDILAGKVYLSIGFNPLASERYNT